MYLSCRFNSIMDSSLVFSPFVLLFANAVLINEKKGEALPRERTPNHRLLNILQFSTHLRYDKSGILIVHDNEAQCSNVVLLRVWCLWCLPFHDTVTHKRLRSASTSGTPASMLDLGSKNFFTYALRQGTVITVMLLDSPWHKHHTSTECCAGDATIQGEWGRELGILYDEHDELLVVTEAIVSC